jgi:recombination protein RecA
MRKDKIDKLIDDVNKEFGEGSAARLGSFPVLKNIDCIPTGSISLDLALGVGGLPKGRIVELYGAESSGKTTLALSIVSQAQKLGLDVSYIDVEYALDPSYCKILGVDVDNLIISQPNSGEEALNLVQKYVESGDIGLIVIDSVAALLPVAEEEGEIGNQLMGVKARLMSQAMRKLTPIIAKKKALVLFINQIRSKMGQMSYGAETTTTPGGMALRFAASVRLEMKTINKIKDGDKIIGNNVRVKITKNKVAPPFKQAEFMLKYGEGIAYELDVLNTGLLYGVIRKEGNTCFYKDEKIGVGINNSWQKLKEDKDLCDRIVKDLLTDE